MEIIIRIRMEWATFENEDNDTLLQRFWHVTRTNLTRMFGFSNFYIPLQTDAVHQDVPNAPILTHWAILNTTITATYHCVPGSVKFAASTCLCNSRRKQESLTTPEEQKKASTRPKRVHSRVKSIHHGVAISQTLQEPESSPVTTSQYLSEV